MTALWPAMRLAPPMAVPGAERAVVMPKARATGRSSLSGWSATQVLAWGLMSPVSFMSTVCPDATRTATTATVCPPLRSMAVAERAGASPE